MGCCKSKRRGTKESQELMKGRSLLEDLKEKYILDYNVYGVGPISKLYLARRKKDNKQIAVKVVSKAELGSQDLDHLKAVLHKMREVDHLHVMKHFEKFEDSLFLYQCIEYCPGEGIFT